MRIKKFLILLIVMVGLSGCYIGAASYEVFVNNRNFFLVPTNHKVILKSGIGREIYDKDKYIYKFKGDDPRCIYGYLTNKDDKPEKVIGWIILSGKEYCKERQGWIFSF